MDTYVHCLHASMAGGLCHVIISYSSLFTHFSASELADIGLAPASSAFQPETTLDFFSSPGEFGKWSSLTVTSG